MSRRNDGAPGDFIGDLPVSSFTHPAGLPVTPPQSRCCDDRLNPPSTRPSRSPPTASTPAFDVAIGTVRAALDNALMESQIGLCKTELMKPYRPWHSLRSPGASRSAAQEYVHSGRGSGGEADEQGGEQYAGGHVGEEVDAVGQGGPAGMAVVLEVEEGGARGAGGRARGSLLQDAGSDERAGAVRRGQEQHGGCLQEQGSSRPSPTGSVYGDVRAGATSPRWNPAAPRT